MNEWMTVDEAAQYVQLGKTVLYNLARDGGIPSNKVGSKWLFNKSDLDSWIRSNKPIERYFLEIPAHIEENIQLREPQIDAYQALYHFFRDGGKVAIIQIPVGCGKSGITAIAPFGIARGRVLVVAPNLTIKDELFESLDITNRQKCLWRTRNILKDGDMTAGPYTGTLDTGNLSVCEKFHVIVSNVHQFSVNSEVWLKRFPSDFFDLIIFDEAHHAPANSWKFVIEHFHEAKIINMTATPFRSGNKEIDGELVYRYPFKKAVLSGYIKRIKTSYVAPSEIEFTDKEATEAYSLEEVLKMKKKDWLSRGISLSDLCNQSIVDNSLEKLEQLRETGTHHQLIAVACSVDHAIKIRAMYEARGFSADIIYGELKDEEKKTIKRRLRSGELDCIIQVQMLGEDFGHPKLSVAAIFRPFKTFAPYVQFVGRILRVIVQNNPSHPDNYGYIVTHAGMNLDVRLQEFKLFENDDQKFWNSVISGQEPDLPDHVTSGTARMRLSEPVVANDEIVDSLIDEAFPSAEEEDIIRELEEKLVSLGLDPASARDMVMSKKKDPTSRQAAAPLKVSPQRE